MVMRPEWSSAFFVVVWICFGVYPREQKNTYTERRPQGCADGHHTTDAQGTASACASAHTTNRNEGAV